MLCFAQGGRHRQSGPLALGLGAGDAERVERRAVAGDLGIDRGTPAPGAAVAFEHEDGRPFAENKSIAFGVERPRDLALAAGARH